jgi:hypothetical protein
MGLDYPTGVGAFLSLYAKSAAVTKFKLQLVMLSLFCVSEHAEARHDLVNAITQVKFRYA